MTTAEILLPLTEDPAEQLNIHIKEIEDIKYPQTTEIPEGVRHSNELKSDQIGTSAVKLGPELENTNVVDMKTESGIQDILTDQVQESRAKSLKKENIIYTAVSEDHNLLETTVPTLDTDTVCQEDIELVKYFILISLQHFVSELLF